MLQLILELVMVALLLGLDAFGLILELHGVVLLHLLNGLLLLLLQVFQLHVVVLLLGLATQVDRSSRRSFHRCLQGKTVDQVHH